MAREPRSARFLAVTCAMVTCLAGAGCASAPPLPAPVVVTVPIVSVDQKVGWILRLEQQRTLRDSGATPIGLVPTPLGGPDRPATAPDLEALALDTDPAIRRRALLAIGRVGAPDGAATLTAALQDADVGARGAAAFALGLLGAKSGVAPLQAALGDASLVVRGRVVEALGLIGDAAAVPAIFQAAAGCGATIAPLAPDDEEWPKAPEIELCRLALFALVRLQNYDGLANLVLDAQGNPVSRWWPVAYALQRIGDRRAAPVLLSLSTTPGTNTAGFAIRGLASLKDARAVPIVAGIALRSDVDVKVRVAAVRALGQIGGTGATEPLVQIIRGETTPQNLLAEAIAAAGASGDAAVFDSLIDFFTHPSAAIRAAALAAAGRTNPESFLLILSGLGRDRDWSVRAALAGILATLDPERVTSAIEDLVADEDARVHGPALEALAAIKAPNLAERSLAALGAADFVERATAARLLGETRPPDGAARLAGAYERGQSDATYVARGAALAALAKYGRDQAAPTLRKALADRDWPVRIRAAELLLSLGEEIAQPERPAFLRQPVELFASPALVRPTYSPHAFIETSLGSIELELNVVDAPLTVQSFVELARAGFFNGIKVHRLVPAFVIQAGDPRGDGDGGPGYAIPDELSWVPYLRGTMGMALDWRDTGGSQWFIALSPQPHLDAKYSVFGRVVAGWDVLDRISQGDVIERIRIWDGVVLQ